MPRLPCASESDRVRRVVKASTMHYPDCKTECRPRRFPGLRTLALPLAAALLVGPRFESDAQITPAPLARQVARVTSAGLYTDSAKKPHNWQITPAHTLLWEGAPYVPVGGSWTPHSLASDSDADWQKDDAALLALKAKGLFDLTITPQGRLAEIAPARWQRLIDALEMNGFHYGIAFGSGMNAPVSGYVVRPSSYRYEDSQSVTAVWQNLSNTDSGLFFLVDGSNDSKMLRQGVAPVTDGTASVPIEVPQGAGRPVTLLLPHKTLPPGEGNLPDVWTAYDAYRDQTLDTLSKIKFGPGLRFFLDPLARHLGVEGENDFLVPDSPAFQLEWESFLNRTYSSVDELQVAWSLDPRVRTVADASHLLPLWAGGRGFPYFYDLQSKATYRLLDTATLKSSWWTDFLRCRNESVVYTMNAFANVLKKQIADVPVVYTWTNTHPIFTNTDRNGGFDGLAVITRGGDTTRLTRTLLPALSQIEQASRTTWFLATEVRGGSPASAPVRQSAEPSNNTSHTVTASLQTPPTTSATPASPPITPGTVGNADEPSAPGYVTHLALIRDLDDIRRVGVKGFFVPLQPDDAKADDWLHSSVGLDWLHEYSGQVSGNAGVANFAPRVLFYPLSAPGPAHTGPIPGLNDTYWLGGFFQGETQDWWPAFSGYRLDRNGDVPQETILVSLQGPRQTRIWMPDNSQVTARNVDGTPVPIKLTGKSIVDVTLDNTPTIFTTGGQPMVPEQAYQDALTQLRALFFYSERQKNPNSENAQMAIDQSQDYAVRKDFVSAYTFARAQLDILAQAVSPYIWLEGEFPAGSTSTKVTGHNFNEVAPNAEASGGRFLRLSTANPPGRLPYAARYAFDVPVTGRYTVWMAGSIPGPETSPFTWYVNNEAERVPANPVPQGPTWLNDHFGWYVLGTVDLEQGARTLTIKVTDRAAKTHDYVFSIDSLLLTRGIFTPDATIKPLPVDGPAIRSFMKDKKKDKN